MFSFSLWESSLLLLPQLVARCILLYSSSATSARRSLVRTVHDHSRRATRRGVLHVPRRDGGPRAQPPMAYVTIHDDTL